MAHDFNEFKKTGESISLWLKQEYSSIRTGRAMPSILDVVTVISYGSPMSINQLATVSIEDPKTLRVVPWDKAVAKDIDKAIRESNLGLSVALDAIGLRISFPELTSDRRTMLLKLAKEKLEEARIKVRVERERILGEADRDEDLNKDDKFRLKGELQKLVDGLNSKLEEALSKKEKEISE